MLTDRGWADGREGAGKWRRRRWWSGFPPSSTLINQRGVQAVGLTAHVEQVAASSVIAVHLVAPATAAGEAAVVGVTGMRGGAAGLGGVRRRCSLVARNWRQSEKVWELQVAFV